MVSVSTPIALQSESFISTVALFGIFSSSLTGKEQKAYLRLPSAWRELWFELSEIQKAKVDEKDRETLRLLRKLVSDYTNLSHEVEAADQAPTDATADTGFEETRSEENFRPETRTTGPDLSKLTMNSKYQDMLRSRQGLPIWGFKNQLLETIAKHQVTIVCGETGCGKSTQVPAFILEEQLAKGNNNCKVYCTEPRRISAVSLARRVSEELGAFANDVGSPRSPVGYAVRLDSRIVSSTKLVYTTTGIVMRMLEASQGLDDVTHLVLDEVHERTIDSDFLLVILRKLMLKRTDLKVILMSATVDAEKFSSYLGGAPVMNVPGRTFPVNTKYLEDAVEYTNYSHQSNGIYQEADELDEDLIDNVAKQKSLDNLDAYSPQTRNTLARLNESKIPYDLILRLLEKLGTDARYAPYNKAVLVFLPGMAEIRRLSDMLGQNQASQSQRWLVFPLHSTIAMEDQEQAFKPPPKGMKKIVLATNIAETGITIPDITCVIDTGRHREMRYGYPIRQCSQN